MLKNRFYFIIFFFSVFVSYGQDTTYYHLKRNQIMGKITWVGQNNEYLNISGKRASLQKGMNFQEFKVVKYVKKKYVILSQIRNSTELKQQYNIVRFTKDTLVLSPEGSDAFALSERNEQNRYVFVSSLLNFQFVELYFEVSFYNYNNPKRRLQFIVYIDSAKRSRVVYKEESFNETTMYTAPVSCVEYEGLIKILSGCDMNCVSSEDTAIDRRFPYQILEIKYNNQDKTVREFKRLPVNCADKLKEFIEDYIESRVNINAPIIERRFIIFY